MALYNADLKPLQPGVSTHPYQHATKLFLSDNYRLAPKQSFLYYVCINVNTSNLSVASLISSLIAPDGVSSQTLIEQYEAGLLAKRVDLPKFSIGTKTLNSYNRKNIITTGISYEPITVTFHDDVAILLIHFGTIITLIILETATTLLRCIRCHTSISQDLETVGALHQGITIRFRF